MRNFSEKTNEQIVETPSSPLGVVRGCPSGPDDDRAKEIAMKNENFTPLIKDGKVMGFVDTCRDFDPCPEEAYQTDRVLEGSSDHGYAVEWREPGSVKHDGREYLAEAVYLFTPEEVNGVEDPGELPWGEALKRIEIVEER